MPHPTELKSGWINEKNKMKKWPRLNFSDISRFCSFVLCKDNLIHRLECDYKQGKVYRYFTNSFIGNILYHNIDEVRILSIENEMCTITACQHETICLNDLS